MSVYNINNRHSIIHTLDIISYSNPPIRYPAFFQHRQNPPVDLRIRLGVYSDRRIRMSVNFNVLRMPRRLNDQSIFDNQFIVVLFVRLYDYASKEEYIFCVRL